MKKLKKIYKIISRTGYSRHILLDDDMWYYTLDLFNNDYDSLNDFKKFLKDFKEQYGDNASLFFEDYNKFLNDMADVVNNITLDDDIINEFTEEVEKFSQIENNLKEGRKYFSIDINTAFDQLIDKHGSLDSPMQSIRERLCNKKLISGSKNIRIISAHTLHSYSLVKFINVITWKIYKSKHFLLEKMKEIGAPLVEVMLDELIFDITDINEDISNLIGDYEISGYKVHTSIFKYHTLYYRDYSEIPHLFVIREMNNGKNVYVSKNCPYFLQIYKQYNNKEITDKDLRVKSVDVAKPYFQFKNPITFITEEEYNILKNKKIGD